MDEDGQEHFILNEDIESKVIDILKKDVAPNLAELEEAALRRYIQSSTAIKHLNHDLNERLQAFDDDNKVIRHNLKIFRDTMKRTRNYQRIWKQSSKQMWDIRPKWVSYKIESGAWKRKRQVFEM